ncbi:MULTISPECIES: flagellin [unclassified Rhizobium]|uniref:flagellin N-terminal helical domain-containing protein n=1 Tax=unclassified Rhizobium TaxID=2613769 RepID=UPI000DDAF5F5|nr:flagellin [Rhizobium sp. UBA1881]
MSSLLTNVSAVAALQTLHSINSGLQSGQNHVSSGLRVAKAADNAAYWSIATTMRSDSSAVSAVSDALGLGSAKVDTAYDSMESVIDVLSEFKAKLVAAEEDGVDKAKIQTELNQLKQQVVSIATSASFSGQNWLNTDIPDIHDDSLNRASVVSSFIRDDAAGVQVTSAPVDLSKISLFNTTGRGLLQADVSVDPTSPSGPTSGTPNIYSVQEYYNFSGPITLSSSDSISFDVVVHPGGTGPDATLNTTISQSDVNSALGISTGTISDGFDMDKVLNHVWSGNGLGLGTGAYGQVQPDGSTLWHSFIVSSRQVSDQPDSHIEITNIVSTLPGGAAGGLGSASYYTARSSSAGTGSGGSGGSSADLRVNFLDIDITNGVGSNLQAVEGMLSRTTAAASTLGSLAMRIGMQMDFASKLKDSIDSGVGRLVDADMEEESSKLAAMQTQQQLAIQALSIANSAPSGIMSLFR